MSVIRCKELPDRRRADEDDVGRRTYIRVFLVITDDRQDGANIVLAAPDLPKRGDWYQTDNEINTDAIVVGRVPNQLRNTANHWEVTIEYKVVEPEFKQKDPLLRLPKLSFTGSKTQVPVIGTLKSTITITPETTNIYSEPHRNSLGDPYPDQAIVDRSIGRLTITRNEETFSPAWAQDYLDAVNADEWMGALPRQIKIDNIECPGPESETVEEVVIVYCPVTYTVDFREEGWVIRKVDEGPDYRATTSSTRHIPFVDKHGQPFIGRLDGKGRPLPCEAKRDPAINPWWSTCSSTITGVYRRHDYPKTKPFGPLGFPSNFMQTS